MPKPFANLKEAPHKCSQVEVNCGDLAGAIGEILSEIESPAGAREKKPPERGWDFCP
jgi:hypothetical protein